MNQDLGEAIREQLELAIKQLKNLVSNKFQKINFFRKDCMETLKAGTFRTMDLSRQDEICETRLTPFMKRWNEFCTKRTCRMNGWPKDLKDFLSSCRSLMNGWPNLRSVLMSTTSTIRSKDQFFLVDEKRVANFNALSALLIALRTSVIQSRMLRKNGETSMSQDFLPGTQQVSLTLQFQLFFRSKRVSLWRLYGG